MLHSRMKRVNHLLRNTIGEILVGDVKDPRLNLVTVSHVETSRDLLKATVFVSVLSDDPEVSAAALEALEGARGYIRSLLAQRVVLKFLPELQFRIDRGSRHAAHIDRILHDLADDRPSEDETD